jgi:hypothetical protein
MSPFELIFQAFSSLTFGLVNDLFTVIVGMITVSFIVVAFKEILRALRGKRLDNYIEEHNLGDEYLEYRDKRVVMAKYRHEYGDL